MKKSRSRKSRTTAAKSLPLAVLADDASLSALRGQTGLLSRAWGWLQSRKSTRSDSQRLRVADTVSLGEKRFVAVVQVAGREFLVAGGPSNIALLAQLNPNEPFENVLRTTLTISGQQPAKRKRSGKRKQTKAKAAVKPVTPSPDREALVANEPTQPVLNKAAGFSPGAQETIKPTRKPSAKRKPAAPLASQENDRNAESANAPVPPAFHVPESFRYVLQNTMATDSSVAGKQANHQNGRAETDHSGHWA